MGAMLFSRLSYYLLSDQVASQLDVFFTTEGSYARKIVDGLQLVVRSAVSGACLIGGIGFLLFGSTIVGSVGGGYLWLSSQDGDIGLLKKHRRDIVGLFALGIPPGWLLWRLSEIITGKPGEEAIYISFMLLFAAVASVLKIASDQQDKVDKGLEKKNEDSFAAALKAPKIGTVSVDGGEQKDVTIGDALKAVSNLTSTKEGRIQAWAAKNEIPLMKLARFAGGVFYGYSLRVMWFFFAATALPVIRNITFGEQSFLSTYWKHGIKTAIDFTDSNK